jgi:phosphatidylserine/phosphatidylglycerophosphate/cardiolipin synthase-like enzyme
MPDITTLRARYFVGAADADPPTEPVPREFDKCKITPLIDASNFNAELEAALSLVGTGPDADANAGHFILIQNWWLGLSGGEYEGMKGFGGSDGPSVKDSDPYYLDGLPDPGPPPTGGTRKLLDVLKDKARVGVDVRVLGWISIGIMGESIYNFGADLFSYKIEYSSVNAATMQSVKDLRSDPELLPHLHSVLNSIGHTAAATHTKLVVVGTNAKAIGFTGGLDLTNERWAHPMHPTSVDAWHDVMAKVEGPAVQALYDWFQDMWSENLKRPVRRFHFEGEEMPGFLPRTPVLPARALPPDPQTENHSVQSLRTVPVFNYKWYNCLPENPPASFAPQGLFEVRSALHKALRAAQTYIYMEDQSFWSREVFGWVNEAIRAHAGLRVILLTNGRADPLDPQFADGHLTGAINHSLLDGLTTAQVDRVRFFKRMLGDFLARDKAGAIQSVQVTAVAKVGPLCHLTLSEVSRVAVAENFMGRDDRGLLVDGVRYKVIGNPAIAENSPVVLVVAPALSGACPAPGIYPVTERRGVTIHTKTTLIDDEWAIIGSANIMRRSLYTDFEHCVAMLDPAGVLVRNYRTELWADHFRHLTPSDFDDVEAALHAWEPAWGTAGAAPWRPDLLKPIPLPMDPDPPLTDKQKTNYDEYVDLDSRQAWGGLCP